MTAVCVAVAWSRALGFDPTTRRPRHDERKCDEIVNSLRNELSAFIRITFVRISIQQYSSTNARNDGDFRVEEIRSCLNTYGTMTAVQFD